MWPEPADACPRVTSDWPQAVAIPDSELPFFPFPLARYEAEMQDLRHQLKQALGEEKEVAEEVERVKRVLQLERGAAARREKELDDMRQAHVREVAALTEAGRRAEQATIPPYFPSHPPFLFCCVTRGRSTPGAARGDVSSGAGSGE